MLDTPLQNFDQIQSSPTIENAPAGEIQSFDESVIPVFSILVQEPVLNNSKPLQWFGDSSISTEGFLNPGQSVENYISTLPDLAETAPQQLSGEWEGDQFELPTDKLRLQETRLASNERTVDALNPNIGPKIVKHAANVIQTELLSNNDSTQTITVRLSPNNLGALHIQIDVHPDQISAHILATELNTADLLVRGKVSLEELLTDFGFDDANVDVSHGSLPQDNESSEHDDNFSENGESIPPDGELKVGKSISIFVGLNLVA